MALKFFTTDPKELLKAFDSHISQKEPKGKITTWVKDGDGDYTHVADAWTKKAWFRAKIVDGALVFNILGTKTAVMSAVVYGYYHGHLTETFLNHFDKQFSNAMSTAKPTADDQIGGSGV